MAPDHPGSFMTKWGFEPGSSRSVSNFRTTTPGVKNIWPAETLWAARMLRRSSGAIPPPLIAVGARNLPSPQNDVLRSHKALKHYFRFFGRTRSDFWRTYKASEQLPDTNSSGHIWKGWGGSDQRVALGPLTLSQVSQIECGPWLR